MPLVLLAQLVAPPLQQGPVRLPEAPPARQRPASGPQPPADLQFTPGEPLKPTPAKPASPLPGFRTAPLDGARPRVQGLSVYGPRRLSSILALCSRSTDAGRNLKACAEALTAQLVADGYLNSRVYISGGGLEVVEGRLVEIRVNSAEERLNHRVRRLLRPLLNSVLHVPSVERDLRLLSGVPGIKSVRGNLGRLGSDVSQATLTVNLQTGAPAWRGDVALRNDGSSGSGEARAVASLLKAGALTFGDALLLYGEASASDQPQFGSLITSISYSLPVSDAVNLTGAFGYSRRNLIELPFPQDGLSTLQYQGLAQVEWVFRESITQRWSAFLGFSGNSYTTLLNGQTLPPPTPQIVRNPSTGFLRYGISGSGIRPAASWGGNLYMLSGITAFTPADQISEWQLAGINPARSTAIGGLLSAGWAVAPSWQLSGRLGGQWAFTNLTPPMRFSLGSDVGIRGLPGQLISGDSGWLGVLEGAWSFWRNRTNTLQLVPFVGGGGVRTALADVDFTDSVGSAGLLLRWLAGQNWAVELGYAHTFQSEDNGGVWQDTWLLGSGLYAKVQYRF